MKKSLARKITLSILAGAVLMSSSVVWAASATGIPTDGSNGWVGINMDLDPNDFELYAPGTSSAPSASNNTVTISSGSVNSNFAGGYSSSGDATDNIVTIIGGEFGDISIYGSYSSGSNAVVRGTVNIAGNPVLTDARLVGAQGWYADGNLNIGYNEGDDDKISGTTITGYKSWTNGNSIEAIANFHTINFKNLKWENGKTVLNVKDTIGLSNTTIGEVSIISGNVKNNDWMNLISVESGSNATTSQSYIDGTIKNINPGNTSANIDVKVYQGVAGIITLDGTLTQDNNNVKLTINDTDAANGITAEAPSNSGGGPGSSELNPQVLVIGESRTAATAFTNQGSELIETGLNALARDNEKDTKVFAAVYGNHSEYETGSHVNVNGWSGIVGVGKTDANGLTVGAFFENGEGNYSTHNVTDFGYLRGDGEAVYNGGGFLVRKDNANGVYAEAAIRAGNLQNELRDAVIGSTGAMGYNIDTFYYGAQIGIGKIIPRGNDGDSIDVYGKFIYTHHDSEDFTIDGDDFHFDSVDSERLRLGFRINEVQTNKLAMYYGAAWEYEFGGDANNTVVGYDLSTPSLEGSTVIGEIGAHYKASEKWSLDLNGRAYVGQREGFSGSVQANYSF